MRKNGILIVEDENIVALHIKSILKRLGYNVLGSISTGEEAIDSVESQKPALILMDVQLGGKYDGIKTAEIIKKKFGISVVYLTAYTDSKTLDRAKLTEPFGYVVKPFDEKELHGTIEMALYKNESEKKLKESNERYLALYERSLDMVFLIDFNGYFLDVNKSAVELLEYNKEDLKKMNVGDVVYDDMERVTDLLIRVRDEGTQREINIFRLKTKSGNIRWVETSFSVIHKNGEPYAIQGIARDITQRVLTAEALKKSEEDYRMVVESINEGLMQVDNDDVIHFVNQRMCDMVGYRREELLGKKAYYLLVDNNDLSFMQNKTWLRNEKLEDRYEIRLKRKDGSSFWAEISGTPVFDNTGKVIGSIGIHTDITQRKKADEAMAHLAVIVESAGNAIISKTLDGTIISWNRGAEIIYGYTAGEVIGKSIKMIYPPESRKEAQEALKKLKRGEKVEFNGAVRVRKDGTQIYITVTISPIKNSAGEIVAASSIANDITDQKMAQMALKLSEQKYKNIFEFAPIGIYRSDSEGQILTANMALARILGYNSIEELLHVNMYKDVYFDQGERDKLISKYENNGPAADVEIMWLKKDRTPLWIQLNAHAIKDAGGKTIYFEGFVRDIDEQKKSAVALIEQEQSYRSLIEYSIDAIYVLQNSRLVLVNPAWQHLFGYNSTEATAENFDIMNIVAPESHPQIINRFNQRSANSALTPRYEMKGLTKEGRIIELEVSVTDIIWKGSPAIQGIYRDITERKKTEEQIRTLSQAVKQSPASIVITDTKGKIEYVNPKFTQITGYALEEVIAKTPRILKTKTLGKEENKKLWDNLSSGKEWKGEFQNKRRNGELYWESSSISHIMNENGKAAHFLFVQMDITDKKLQEEQIIIAKENAEKSDRLKTEFLAQMSHEIRTPLNNILTYTSVLREEFEEKLPAGLESAFKVIDSSAQRLIRTIELLLSLSRIQTGNFETKYEQIDLDSDLIEDLSLEFYSRAKEKNLNLNYENRADNTLVVCDKYSTGQIFVNLIDNAIKYSKKGEIKISIYNKDKNKLCVEVKDMGIGISEKYLPDLFNPFSQEDMGITRHFEGTGLGLALVKKYTELNAAEIEVTSHKGAGTKFTVTFDLDRGRSLLESGSS